nr:hypothetical protein [Kribbella qitaiheensis]
MNGIGNVFVEVISVSTNPGQTVSTSIPSGAEPDPERLEQIDLRGLGGAVRLRTGQAAIPRDRGDSDDHPGTALAQVGDQGAEAVREATEVHVQVPVERLDVELVAHLLPVAGAQYDDVEPAERLDHLIQRGLDLPGVGDVERRDRHPVTGDGAQSVRSASGDRHRRAPTDELGGERRADPR